MKTKGNEMTTSANIVSTTIAIASAVEWMTAICKQHGIKGAVDKSADTVYLNGRFGANAFGGARIVKFERMFNRVKAGFEKSKNWVAQPGNTFERNVYISDDGRFKAVVYDRYNGSGGYKVATKSIGVTITDLVPQ